MSRVLVVALAVSNSLLLTHILCPHITRRVRRWLRRLSSKRRDALVTPPRMNEVERAVHEELGGLLGRDYTPPLPQPVADALDRSCLCFLATTGQSLEPHLSLMRYTYTSGLDPDDEERSEVMVISTQRKTKKFDILTENENVALLVHDFQTQRECAQRMPLPRRLRHTIGTWAPLTPRPPPRASSDDGANYESLGTRAKYSITLNGTVRVESGELAERYRAIHLARTRCVSADGAC